MLLSTVSGSDVADKNRNGIPDDRERAARGTSGPTIDTRGGVSNPMDPWASINSGGQVRGTAGPVFKRPAQNPLGGGAGGATSERSGRPGGGTFGAPKQAGSFLQKQQPMMEDTGLPSFLANLMEALGMTSGGGGADFDPLRNDARSRGAEYDARLAAMYEQLQNEMRQDGTGIQQNYQGAIDQNAARTMEAQQSVQGASDDAAQRNLQQLQALGIGEAAGNIVSEGRDLNSDTAGAVQDAIARGQISGENLAQNKQSANTHNTNLVGAAGLEGNLQRARVQSELGSLLSQYDMQEQEANQQAQQQSLSQAMSLAGALTDDQWKRQGYQDDLSQYLAEQQSAQQQGMQPNKLSQSMQFLQQLMQSPQFADQDIESLLPYIQALGGIGKLV